MAQLDPLVGKTIAGRYRVTDLIGLGGMGAVYSAIQEPLGRTVALKVLKPSFARDDVVVARFKKEAAIVAELSHPNVVTLHDYGETEDGLLFIVMEHLRGSTLSTVLRSRGVMPWQRTLPLIKDVVRALSAAHALGVIHRDLKLDNIMLVQDGERDIVKVLDFGVAKTLNKVDAQEAALTQTDSSPGTPGYMSPELARGITTDPRSDFYALGVVWFELIVGHRPFTDRNAMDLFLHQMTLPVPRIRDAAPQLDVPEAIDTLVCRMLDKDPAKRPADCAALLEAMFAMEEELPTDPRRRRTSSGDSIPAAPVVVTPAPTLPTLGGLFLPTQAGGHPPFTGPGSESQDDAPTETTTSLPFKDPASIATLPSTQAQSLPIVAPSIDIDSLRQDPGVVVAAAVARAQTRSRAPIAAAVVVVAATLVAIAALRPAGSGQNDLEGVAADARGPLVYTVDRSAPSTRTAAPIAFGASARPTASARTAGTAATTTTTTTTTTPTTTSSSAPTALDAEPQPASVKIEPPEVVPASGVTALHETTATSAPPDIPALRQRMSAVSDQLRERFLLPDDVPNYRQLSIAIDKAIGESRAADADAALRDLERALSSLRITESFIRKKIARVEANLPKEKGWPRTDAQRAELGALRTDIAERFGAGDLPGANYALNKLWLFSLKARQTRE